MLCAKNSQDWEECSFIFFFPVTMIDILELLNSNEQHKAIVSLQGTQTLHSLQSGVSYCSSQTRPGNEYSNVLVTVLLL